MIIKDRYLFNVEFLIIFLLHYYFFILLFYYYFYNIFLYNKYRENKYYIKIIKIDFFINF